MQDSYMARASITVSVGTHKLLKDARLEGESIDAVMCREVFGDTVFKYTKPATRLTGHLAGYDSATAPELAWPVRLEIARSEIRKKAQARSDAAEKMAATSPKEPAK
jgi:hypothetical protein